MTILSVECAGSLEEAIERLSEREEMTGENAVECEECEVKVGVERGWALRETGDIFVVAVKRFAFDWARMSRRKLNSRFTFPLSLSLLPGSPYELAAVVVHAGSATSGHYYSFIRSNGGWIEYNDARVRWHGTTLQESEVFGGEGSTRSAYLLFYIRAGLSLAPPAAGEVPPEIAESNARDRRTTLALSAELAPLSACPRWLFGIQARVPREGIEVLLEGARLEEAGVAPAFARLTDSGSRRVRRAAARYLLRLPSLPRLQLPPVFKESDELLAFASRAGRAKDWWPRFTKTSSPIAEAVIAATPDIMAWRSPIALVRYCVNSRPRTKEVIAHLLSPADPCFALLPPLVAMRDDLAAWRVDALFTSVLNFFLDPALPPSLLDYLPLLLSTLSSTDERGRAWCVAHSTQLSQLCLGMKVIV